MDAPDRHESEIAELKYQLAYADDLTEKEKLEIRRRLVELLSGGGDDDS